MSVVSVWLQISNICEGEDDSTVEEHISVLKRELSKTRPNEAIVNERMRRSLAHRRQLIESTTVDIVLESYPALKLDSQVC